MMLIGIFLTTLLVAMLYFVAGIGETITYRERMQDAADTGALGGALLYARTMNVIVLLNLTIAAVLAVYVGVRTATIILLMALGSASSSCNPLNPGACAAAACLALSIAPHCNKVRNAERIAREVSIAAHEASARLRDGVRLAAMGRPLLTAREHYRPPVNVAAGHGVAPPLQDDPTNRICEDAAPLPLSLEALGISAATALVATDSALDSAICGDSYVSSAAGAAVLLNPLVCLLSRRDVRPPQRVRPGVELGDEPFQFRAFVQGTAPFDRQTERVETIATWGRGDDGGLGSSAISALEAASTLGVAQAEYYYDDDEPRDEWMWGMKWRARLRRFRTPASCGSIPVVGTFCGLLNGAVVH
ncbi:MAG: hypothetical protein AAGH15_08335 [Myxococcota bacterium]